MKIKLELLLLIILVPTAVGAVVWTASSARAPLSPTKSAFAQQSGYRIRPKGINEEFPCPCNQSSPETFSVDKMVGNVNLTTTFSGGRRMGGIVYTCNYSYGYGTLRKLSSCNEDTNLPNTLTVTFSQPIDGLGVTINGKTYIQDEQTPQTITFTTGGNSQTKPMQPSPWGNPSYGFLTFSAPGPITSFTVASSYNQWSFAIEEVSFSGLYSPTPTPTPTPLPTPTPTPTQCTACACRPQIVVGPGGEEQPSSPQ